MKREERMISNEKLFRTHVTRLGLFSLFSLSSLFSLLFFTRMVLMLIAGVGTTHLKAGIVHAD